MYETWKIDQGAQPDQLRTVRLEDYGTLQSALAGLLARGPGSYRVCDDDGNVLDVQVFRSLAPAEVLAVGWDGAAGPLPRMSFDYYTAVSG